MVPWVSAIRSLFRFSIAVPSHEFRSRPEGLKGRGRPFFVSPASYLSSLFLDRETLPRASLVESGYGSSVWEVNVIRARTLLSEGLNGDRGILSLDHTSNAV